MLEISSKIDPTKIVRQGVENQPDQSVISILNHRRHAVICIESIDNSGRYWMRLCDFMPKNKTPYDDYYYLSMLVTDRIYEGEIRNYLLRNMAEKSLEQISAAIQTLNLGELGRVCPNINPDCGSLCFQVSREIGQQLSTDIAETEGSPPPFNIYGTNAVRFMKNHSAHNCTTWAIERLRAVGISVPNSKNRCNSCLPEDASDYTEEKKCNLL